MYRWIQCVSPICEPQLEKLSVNWTHGVLCTSFCHKNFPLLSPCFWKKACDTNSFPSFRPGNLHNDPLFKCQSARSWCMFSGYTPSTDLTRCNRRQIGDPCNTDEDCSAVIDNGQCVHGLCVCKSGTIVNTLLTACYVRK